MPLGLKHKISKIVPQLPRVRTHKSAARPAPRLLAEFGMLPDPVDVGRKCLRELPCARLELRLVVEEKSSSAAAVPPALWRHQRGG